MLPRPTSALLLATVLVLLASTTRAQVRCSVGPRLGLNLATSHFGEPPEGRLGYRAGVEAGLLGSVSVGHVALRPALLFSQKGFTQRIPNITTSTGTKPPVLGEQQISHRLNYLTVPLNVAYAAHPDGQGFQVFAGPYLGLLVDGQSDYRFTSAGSTVFSQSFDILPDRDARRFDAGLQAGLGYRYQWYLLELTYSLGLRNNAVPQADPSRDRVPYYNRAVQASITYLFGPKS